jgi:pimeloyl-ACP methyl ester carboxylesterase
MSAPVTLPLRVRVGGPTPATDAPPVVLVHGYGVSSSYLVPLAHALAPSHRVYVPDLPGHGRSPHAPAPLDVPALADALLAALTALDVQRAVLVGNSLGCAIAVEAAVRAPARVAGCC